MSSQAVTALTVDRVTLRAYHIWSSRHDQPRCLLALHSVRGLDFSMALPDRFYQGDQECGVVIDKARACATPASPAYARAIRLVFALVSLVVSSKGKDGAASDSNGLEIIEERIPNRSHAGLDMTSPAFGIESSSLVSMKTITASNRRSKSWSKKARRLPYDSRTIQSRNRSGLDHPKRTMKSIT